MPTIADFVAPGTPAPDFKLPDLDGTIHALGGYDAPVLVVAFLCNHCPYVRHVERRLGEVAAEYADRGVTFVGICPNDARTVPDDAAERLREQAVRAGWTFHYLLDLSQDVAHAYGAACTPDFFVYGPDRRLAYRGAMDESSPGNSKPNDAAALRAALDATLDGVAVPQPHVPSMGCGIKWHAAR